MNPVSAALLTGILLLVVAAPRRWALLALIASTLFLTQGNAVTIAGLNIWPLRFVVVAAFVRVVSKSEFALRNWSTLDSAVMSVYGYSSVVWILRSDTLSAEQFGFAVDRILWYVACRGLVSKLDDARCLLIAMLWLLFPYTALVAMERVTGQSSFALVGGNWGLYIRDGITRAQGSFRHASLLGSIAAAFLAMYLGLLWRRRDRVAGVAGAVLCTALVVMTHSGGPMTSAITAATGWLMWRLRTRMRLVRYGIVAVLVTLVFVMKAPIWYLPYKVSQFVGGGGYHRSALMESAWNDLGRWWLVGMDLRDTVSWIPYAHGETGGADITNEFVAIGIKGGLAALGLLILVLTRAFRAVGERLAAIRRENPEDVATEAVVWGVGVALAVHTVSWLGIAYFDQSWAIWLLHASAAAAPLSAAVAPKQTRQDIKDNPPAINPTSVPSVLSHKAPAWSTHRRRTRAATSAASRSVSLAKWQRP